LPHDDHLFGDSNGCKQRLSMIIATGDDETGDPLHVRQRKRIDAVLI
jgi:hypothetical protein